MSQIPTRSPGACALCGKQCFEVMEKYPRNHVLAGKVRRVSTPIKGAWRQSFLLLDGRHSSITMCGDCWVDSSNIVGVWKRLCEAYVMDLDPDYRVAMGMRPRTPEQEIRAREGARRYVMNVPIGTLYTEQWSKIK